MLSRYYYSRLVGMTPIRSSECQPRSQCDLMLRSEAERFSNFRETNQGSATDEGHLHGGTPLLTCLLYRLHSVTGALLSRTLEARCAQCIRKTGSNRLDCLHQLPANRLRAVL